MSFLRTLHTVRHLRPVQVVDRITRRLRNVAARVHAVGGPYTLRGRPPQPPAASDAATVEADGFHFLSVSRPHAGADRWEPAGASRLWVYQLHGFRYLNALPQPRARALVLDWIDQNPPVRGAGWEPYTLSLRAREWIEWLLANPGLQPADKKRIVQSIAAQVAGLAAQLEFHLLANHLLENAITLCWAGLSLEGPAVEDWRDTGLQLLARELAEQVLPDGTHVERSPMYQASITEALLRLSGAAHATQRPFGQAVRALAQPAAQRLWDSLSCLVHPDGDYALFNDTALGQAPRPDALARRFALTPAEPSGPAWHLAGAGYMGWAGPTGTWLVFDAGELGPHYQPGHGHADTLSFELSHAGQRLITDTGIHTYAAGATRAWDRGTAAHNTILVDGRDQSEVWASFRCGRRALPVGAAMEAGAETCLMNGAYVGPAGAFRHVRHERALRLARDRVIAQDRVLLRGGHRLTSRLHLAPGVGARREGQAILLEREGRNVGRLRWKGPDWNVRRSPYHPSFGVEVERICLEATGTFRHALDLGWTLDLV